MRAKMSKGKIIFNVINLILLLLMMYIIFVPKRPFFWLTEDMVEKIEWRYDYNYDDHEAYYIELAPEDRQMVVKGLQLYGFTRPMLDLEVKYASGSGSNPVRITLKNGKIFFFHDKNRWAYLYFKNGEHAGADYEDLDVDQKYRITIKNADDEKSKKGSELISAGTERYMLEYGWPGNTLLP